MDVHNSTWCSFDIRKQVSLLVDFTCACTCYYFFFGSITARSLSFRDERFHGRQIGSIASEPFSKIERFIFNSFYFFINRLNDDLEGRVAGGGINGILPKLNALKKSILREQCPLKGVPRCPPASKR